MSDSGIRKLFMRKRDDGDEKDDEEGSAKKPKVDASSTSSSQEPKVVSKFFASSDVPVLTKAQPMDTKPPPPKPSPATKRKPSDEECVVIDDDEEEPPPKKGKVKKEPPKPNPAAKAEPRQAPKAEKAEAEGDTAEEDTKKKKFNPWNQQTAEVPNKHLKDDKIANHPGSETCLAGLTFVITGVLDSLERSEATDLINRYGGKVTGSVSGKTSFVLTGSDAGESKLKKAREKGTKTVDEDGLFQLIVERTAKGGGAPAPPPKGGSKAGKAKGTPGKSAAQASSSGSPPSEAKQGGSGGGGKREGGAFGGGGAKGAVGKAAAQGGGKGVSGGEGQVGGIRSLWVDKHAPRSRKDLMGNGQQINQLDAWMRCFGDEEKQSAERKTSKADGKKPDIHSFKSVLLSGPPGVGKSSAAKIIAEQHGYSVVQLNASDVRNKAGLREHITPLTTNQSLSAWCGAAASQPTGGVGAGAGKTCLIMDEVDGMSGGDRGGTTELIEMIKHTKAPIICIANDAYCPKLKSLCNNTFPLKFGKPIKTMVAKRIKEIAQSEGFNIPNPVVLEKLVEEGGNDIRHIINILQMWRMDSDVLSYADLDRKMKDGHKEKSVLQTSLFDVADYFLDRKHAKASLGEKLDMFFYDADAMPLHIHENYLKNRPDILPSETGKYAEFNCMRRFADAADAIAEGDVVGNCIRGKQQWALMPLQGVVSTVQSASFVRGSPGSWANSTGADAWRRPTMGFTFLGKMSTANKKKRLVGDIERSMRDISSANRTEVACDYIPLLRARLTAPLIAEGQNGIGEVVALMEEYGLDKESHDAITKELLLSKGSEDPMGQVDAKVKAALTRAWNAGSHKIKFVRGKAGADALASKGTGGFNIGRSGEMEKEGDEGGDEEEDEEEGEKGAASAVGKGGAGKGKGKASGGGSGGKGSGATKGKAAAGGGGGGGKGPSSASAGKGKASGGGGEGKGKGDGSGTGAGAAAKSPIPGGGVGGGSAKKPAAGGGGSRDIASFFQKK